MFDELSHKFKLIFADKMLLRRILFVLFAFLVFRALANIPIPGIDIEKLRQFFENNQFLNLASIFSGGGLANLSIVMLGVGPFITASIIMQLMTILSPKIKSMYHEEGEAGRAKFAQYSRYLSVPLATLQAYGFLMLLTKQGIIPQMDLLTTITNVTVVVAGSVLLMWIGELVTEFGIGNGVSLIIFAGIVSRIPSALSQLAFTFDITQLPAYLGLFALALFVTAAVVFITEAERPIKITYARSGNLQVGHSTLPLRVNQAGVIPIIFALSILLFPQMIAGFLINSNISAIASVAEFLRNSLANQFIYGILYFALVFLFTFFYTAITFEPHKVAEDLQKRGAFIPGIRPGEHTEDYLGVVVTRITLAGALFLAIIAVLPIVVQWLTGITVLTIGGTALLIVVAVVLDLVKRVDTQLTDHEYK